MYWVATRANFTGLAKQKRKQKSDFNGLNGPKLLMPVTKRYNAGIQRAKGLLELASGLYDSSLASESWKTAEGVLQTDTPIGNTLKLSLTPKPNDRKGIALSFTTGGVAARPTVAPRP